MQETKTITRSKSYDSFDLFKFIVSFMVMIVHTRIFGDSRFHWLHPWCRILIPVYFMISAFLFFSKYDRLPDGEKNTYLWKFVKRDLILYLFWFIVFLPFTTIYRNYLHKGIVNDYKMSALTPEDLQHILSGTVTERTPQVVHGSKNTNVLFFWSGHGKYDGMIIHHLDLDRQAFCKIQGPSACGRYQNSGCGLRVFPGPFIL